MELSGRGPVAMPPRIPSGIFMKTIVFLLSAGLVLGQARAAETDKDAAQTRAQNLARCTDRDANISIAGCSALILAGQETDAKLAAILQRRGILYYNKGLTDLAIADQTAVIALKPQTASAWYDRGEAYLAKGLADQAIADYSQAIAIKPRYAEAFADRGVAYASQGRADQAIADETSAIALAPGFAEAWCDRGLAYKSKGLMDLAIADYTKAIALQSDYGSAYYNRGLAKQAKGDMAGGALDIAWAMKNDPASVK